MSRDGRTFIVAENDLVYFKQFCGNEDSSSGPPHMQLLKAVGGVELQPERIIAGGAVEKLDDGTFKTKWSSGTCNLGVDVKTQVNQEFPDEAQRRVLRGLAVGEAASAEIATVIGRAWEASATEVMHGFISEKTVSEIKVACHEKQTGLDALPQITSYSVPIQQLKDGSEKVDFTRSPAGLLTVDRLHQLLSGRMLYRVKEIYFDAQTQIMVNQDGGRAMGRLFNRCECLKDVNFRDMEITSFALWHFADELAPNRPVESFRFWGNDEMMTSKDGAIAMGMIWGKCPKLSKVSFEWTGFTPEVLGELVQRLPEQSPLKDVSFGNNSEMLTNADGIHAAAQLLGKCKGLEKFSFIETGITPALLRQFVAEVPPHLGVREVFLGSNERMLVNPEGRDAMVEFVSKTVHLEKIWLMANMCPPSEEREFRRRLQAARPLVKVLLQPSDSQ